jgi:hypothetical protein
MGGKRAKISELEQRLRNHEEDSNFHAREAQKLAREIRKLKEQQS